MKESPEKPKIISELSINELRIEEQKAHDRLSNLLHEVQQLPPGEGRDKAAQSAYDQFEAIVAMKSLLGDRLREAVSNIKDDDTSLDDKRFPSARYE